MNSKRILFYVPGQDALNNGVYFSQVYGLARYVKTLGAKCLIVATDYSVEGYYDREIGGVEFVSVPISNKYVPLPFIYRKLRAAAEPARERIHEFKPTHVYFRDSFAAKAGMPLAKKLGAKVVMSCRGAGMAEGYKSLKEYVKEWILQFTTWRVFCKSDHINAVANTLMDHIRGFYRYRGPMSILPCCVMEEKFETITAERRADIRREMNIPEDAKVLLYSGGMGWYQCTEELMTLFKKVHEADPKIVFMILTKAVEELNAAMDKVGLPRECVRVRPCAPMEVADYQQSADVGVILRKQDDVNKYASPVKIGEYLSAGLGIIVSPWIGDVGAMLEGKQYAYMLKDENDAATIAAFVNQVGEVAKQQAREFARSYYTYEGNADAVKAMFA